MYWSAKIFFLIDAKTCIERIGSGVLSGAILKSSTFTKISSESNESCFLLIGLSGSVSDESDILGDKFSVDFCCAEGLGAAFVLLLESHCQTEMLRDLRYLLVDLTGADGMTLSATCPSFDTRAGLEAPRPTKAQADLLVVPDTAWEMVQHPG